MDAERGGGVIEMDLGQFDTTATAEDGVDMPILHPVTNVPLLDGETPVTIRVCGMDSARFRKAARANADRRLRGARYRAPSADELDAEGLELLVKCTLGWQGIELDGAVLAYSPANARTLYTRLAWLREAVDQFIADRARFLAPSATTS